MDLGAILQNPVKETPALSTDSLLKTIAAWKHRKQRDPDWTPSDAAVQLDPLFTAFSTVWEHYPLLSCAESVDLGVGTNGKRDNDTQETGDEALKKRQRGDDGPSDLTEDAPMQDVDTTEDDIQYTLMLTLDVMHNLGGGYRLFISQYKSSTGNVIVYFGPRRSSKQKTNDTLGIMTIRVIDVTELLLQLSAGNLKLYFEKYFRPKWDYVCQSPLQIHINSKRRIQWDLFKIGLSDIRPPSTNRIVNVFLTFEKTLELWRPVGNEFFWPELFSEHNVSTTPGTRLGVYLQPLTRSLDLFVDINYLQKEFMYDTVYEMAKSTIQYWDTMPPTPDDADLKRERRIKEGWDPLPFDLFSHEVPGRSFYKMVFSDFYTLRHTLWRDYFNTHKQISLSADWLTLVPDSLSFLKECLLFMDRAAYANPKILRTRAKITFVITIRDENVMLTRVFWELLIFLQNSEWKCLVFRITIPYFLELVYGTFQVFSLETLINKMKSGPNLMGTSCKLIYDITPQFARQMKIVYE